MFVNLSNHPVVKWDAAQQAAAEDLGFGAPVDITGGMPMVPSTATTTEVEAMADSLVVKALAMDARAAHVAGEMTLTYALVSRLQKHGIPCFAATTERMVLETVNPDGSVTKTAVFAFRQWRKYPSAS